VAQVPGLKASIPVTHRGVGASGRLGGGLDESFEKEKPVGRIMQWFIVKLNSVSRVFQENFGIGNFHHFLFLALLGTISALVAFLVDLVAFNAIDCTYLPSFTLDYSQTNHLQRLRIQLLP
jgi:hypothetical protein